MFAQSNTRFPERSLYFSAMAMELPWPDRDSFTAFCRSSSLYTRRCAFPSLLSAEAPCARYRLIQLHRGMSYPSSTRCFPHTHPPDEALLD